MPGKEYADKPYYNDSSANERMVRGYPPPNLFNLFNDFIVCNELSMSRGVTHILKDFFDKMSPEDKARIRDQAEQRRHLDREKTA